MLDEYAYLHKNRKLAPKWSGPHTVLRLIHDTNVELRLANNRKTVVHVNRLKPYHFPMLTPPVPDSNSDPPQQQPLPSPPLSHVNGDISHDKDDTQDEGQFVNDRFVPFQADEFNQDPFNIPLADNCLLYTPT